ncbi:Dolichyl-phosphate-mannose-protein mannosyltransferase [Gimesia alba]|uniref:Dolichyl-phosphate-mannose-protein mannosyltransferase n=1 Tax=Gimesia alba TaxID=2527973 RepID=A0A517RK65_9PLAN|nr:phospholipid carrier-dependent glycosyltransferase [Gimesia alba]QDT44277.1 Dolichyl-phosphate-mannose-protein mannosyltransferase [Gimesia alba]
MENQSGLAKSVVINIQRLFERICSNNRLAGLSVSFLLLVHAGMLAYSATKHSPTMLEPAFLVAGLHHWESGQFELFRVNPPLVRMLAALPVKAVGYESDWSGINQKLGARPEFRIGIDFVRVNGERSIWLFTIARWMCIPFSLIGGLICFFWSKELWGNNCAGLFSLTLWCFEPNIIAHAELISTDCAATTFGLASSYGFWKWLKKPTWLRATFAGVLLGLAELSKSTWIILFGLWPLLWLFWCSVEWKSNKMNLSPQPRPKFSQITFILLLGLYLLNLGYGFEGSLTKLNEFTFISKTMSGIEKDCKEGNRFSGTIWGELMVPLPANYLRGIDIQKKDFEDYEQQNYLRGEWKDGGWYYYYFYALLVKVPIGMLLLFLVALSTYFLFPVEVQSHWRDEIILIIPAVVLFIFVSLQTEVNAHLRYLLPAFGFVFIFIGRPFFWLTNNSIPAIVYSSVRMLSFLCTVWVITSCVYVYPNQLAYFNEFVGYMKNGSKHLLGSNLDWGQDLLYLKKARHQSKDLRLGYHGSIDPTSLGISFSQPPNFSDIEDVKIFFDANPQAVCAVSVNKLFGTGGYIFNGDNRLAIIAPDYFKGLRSYKASSQVGGSIWIYTASSLKNKNDTNQIEF